MKALIDFLQSTAQTIRGIETEAEIALHQDKDAARYRAHMRHKAQILADLAQNAAAFLQDVPEPRRQAILQRLHAMSQSARRSLDLDSTFYMSALLYPEDHTPGTPNDLEKWVAELARRG
jgi:hypothetical protein